MAVSRELEFVGTLGEGGFGTVYLANLHGRDRFVRRVAVKVMRDAPHDLGDRLARHRDEARLLGLLAHENIVQVLDLTEVGGRPAVVMEYVEGADVAHLIMRLHQDDQPFPVRAALEIAAATAAALDAAWNLPSPQGGRPLRVVHRDIKPANILVTPSGGVKVLDFGVARADFARESLSGSHVFGTPRYMAPEIWLAGDTGPAVDIYALGVTLLDMLGASVFERPPIQPVSRYDAHVAAAVAHLPDGPRELIGRCLAAEPDARPSAAAVVEELGRLLEETNGETLGRLARRLIPRIAADKRKNAAPGNMPPRAVLDPSGPPVNVPSEATVAYPVDRSAPLQLVGAGVGVLGALVAAGLAGVVVLAVGWRSWRNGEAAASEVAVAEAGAPVGDPQVVLADGAGPPGGTSPDPVAVPVPLGTQLPTPPADPAPVPLEGSGPQPSPPRPGPKPEGSNHPDPKPPPPEEPDPVEEVVVPAPPPVESAPALYPVRFVDPVLSDTLSVDGTPISSGTTLNLPAGGYKLVVHRDGAKYDLNCDFSTGGAFGVTKVTVAGTPDEKGSWRCTLNLSK